jgi:Alpha amylase, C-terminal all-beta domain
MRPIINSPSKTCFESSVCRTDLMEKASLSSPAPFTHSLLMVASGGWRHPKFSSVKFLSGLYREIINTDGETYGGSNAGNLGGVHSEARKWMGREHSILIQLSPPATVAFKLEQ